MRTYKRSLWLVALFALVMCATVIAPSIAWAEAPDVTIDKTAGPLQKNEQTGDMETNVNLTLASEYDPSGPGGEPFSYIAKGSYVTDIVGSDFELVKDPSRITLKVGNEELAGEQIYDFDMGFGKRADGSYRYRLNTDGNVLTFTVNDIVTKDEPVCLTYPLKLKNPPTAIGTYHFNTNESAVLQAYDTNVKRYDKVNFPVPSVDYLIGGVTVNYVDVNGTALADSVTMTGQVGTAYTTQQKEFDGYVFKKMDDGSAPAEGTYAEGTLAVTYVYAKAGKVTVRYVDEKGTELADSVTTTGEVGTAYTAQQKSIEGYTFKKMDDGSAPAEGTYAEGTLTVTFVYSKDTVPNKPDNPNKPDKPGKSGKTSSGKKHGVIPDMGDAGNVMAISAAALGGGTALLSLRRKMKGMTK